MILYFRMIATARAINKSLGHLTTEKNSLSALLKIFSPRLITRNSPSTKHSKINTGKRDHSLENNPSQSNKCHQQIEFQWWGIWAIAQYIDHLAKRVKIQICSESGFGTPRSETTREAVTVRNGANRPGRLKNVYEAKQRSSSGWIHGILEGS